TLQSSIGTTKIAFADVGRAADIDAMVAEAIARGHGGTWRDETVAGIRLRLEPASVPLRLLYDHDRAAKVVSSFTGRVTLGSINATIVRGNAGFVVTPSTDGSQVDGAPAVADNHPVICTPAH